MQPPYDPRDYLFDELTPGERAEMERFLETSSEARAELEQLQLTQRALLSLPDEAPPQRIAFVSDKVFEPSLLARVGRWLRADGPGLAFGTSLALAVLFAGIGWTEPRVSSTDAGWELAFGATPAEPALAPQPVALGQEEIRAIVVEALARGAEEDREALVKLVAEQAEQSRRQWRSELDAAQSDIESGLRIVNANYEQLYSQVATRVAVAQ
jgi:hypothetical protein